MQKLFKSKGIEILSYKLETICDYFEILVNPNEGTFHNGIFDAIMTSKLFIHLYINYVNIDDNDTLQKYQEKNSKKERMTSLKKLIK